MKLTLVTYEIVDKYDDMDYIRYKYQIDDNKHLLEASFNRHHRDIVYNFIYMIANLYQVKRLKVHYKNMMYTLQGNTITEYQKY